MNCSVWFQISLGSTQASTCWQPTKVTKRLSLKRQKAEDKHLSLEQLITAASMCACSDQFLLSTYLGADFKTLKGPVEQYRFIASRLATLAQNNSRKKCILITVLFDIPGKGKMQHIIMALAQKREDGCRKLKKGRSKSVISTTFGSALLTLLISRYKYQTDVKYKNMAWTLEYIPLCM